MIWAIISRTGDILQLIGLATVTTGAVFTTWKVAKIVKHFSKA